MANQKVTLVFQRNIELTIKYGTVMPNDVTNK